MSKILILNGAHPYNFAPGRLNTTFAELARNHLTSQGHEVRMTTVFEGYDVETEIENHLWADTVILQYPVHWMGLPWSFKKYMDEVYTSAMDGRLASGDGRTSAAPKLNYGMGGNMQDTRYMLSVTFNAPEEAFNAPNEPFLQGDSVDDLMKPIHLTAKFLGMTALPSFVAYDVMKDPQIETDLARFTAHLTRLFPTDANSAAA